VLAAPIIVPLLGVGEAKAEHTVAGDAAARQDGKRLAGLRRQALYRVAIEGCDAGQGSGLPGVGLGALAEGGLDAGEGGEALARVGGDAGALA